MSDFPIRSWGTTTYPRRDHDSQEHGGRARWGRWHAFEDSNPDPGGTTLLSRPSRR